NSCVGRYYHRDCMPLGSLLLSRDAHAISVLQQTLAKLSIDVEVCRGAKPGTEILFSEKFDAVIVDCDDLQGGFSGLKALRKSPSNRTSVSFAILNGTTSTREAFEHGATFVMQKPLTPLSAMRCISAGLGLMVRERRRYFRHPIELEVIFRFEQNQEIRAITSNVSDGGMAIRSVAPLARGESGSLSFAVPENRGIVQTKAEVVWADGNGRAGVRFME